MAKMVFEIIMRTTCAGSLIAPEAGKFGTAGKFARAMPTIFVLERPERICTQWLSINLMLISPSESSFTYSYSFRAGTVHDPSFLTFAGQLVRRLKSRSVAVIVSLSPAASNRKLERIGIVVL